MNPTLKPSPLLADVLPGYTVLGILAACYLNQNRGQFQGLLNSKDLLAIVAGLGAASFVAAWILGTVLDPVRNLIEELLDSKWELGWNFLLEASESDITKLNESWLAYYFLNGNYAVGLSAIIILRELGIIQMSVSWLTLVCISLAVFLADGFLLRKEIRKLICQHSGKHVMSQLLPHDEVYTRLACTKDRSHGVGVIAIRPIPKGCYPFRDDDTEMVWVERAKTDLLSPEMRELYEDFGVLNANRWCVPRSFNKLTPAWFLNCSTANPNIGCDENLEFYTLRPIERGEELTTDYRKYSEFTKGCEKP